MNTVHYYGWQALTAIDQSTDSFLDNIKSPIHATVEELDTLEHGFAALSDLQLRGTIAAGDGIVFKMIMPTNEEVEGDVTAYKLEKANMHMVYRYSIFFFFCSPCVFCFPLGFLQFEMQVCYDCI
jgi:hypothetical protein